MRGRCRWLARPSPAPNKVCPTIPGRGSPAISVSAAHRVSICAICCALALLPAPTTAQIAPPSGVTPPTEIRPLPPLLPPAPLEPPPSPEFRLPPLTPPAGPGRLSGSVRVFVRTFRIVGATVFPEPELHALVAPYEGRRIGNAELEDARRRLTSHYVQRGYLNSGAVIPDQDVAGGVVTLQIVEGRLTDIIVTGTKHFSPNFIRERVALPPSQPLNLGPLQERLQTLLLNPLLERINAELAPGERPGEAVLKLDVREAPPYEAGYAFSNGRSPAVGASQHELWLGARNLFGRGFGLQVRTAQTEGLGDYSLLFGGPVNASDTRFLLRLDKTRSVLVESPLQSLDIASRSSGVELGLSHPLVRTPQRELLVGAAWYRRDNATFFLGEPFGFTPGLPEGRSTLKALRLTGDFLDRSESQVFAARLTFRLGLGGQGATVNPGFPDSVFVARLLQLQWARRLSEAGNQVLVRFDLQDANGTLLPSEKFAVGGMQSVRGYRENLLVKDRGWTGSVEYRHPIERWFAGPGGAPPEIGRLQLAAFVDAGRGADEQDTSTGPRRLRSAGLGVLWDPVPGAQFQVYLARPHTKVTLSHRALEDRGVHFRFAFQQLF